MMQEKMKQFTEDLSLLEKAMESLSVNLDTIRGRVDSEEIITEQEYADLIQSLTDCREKQKKLSQIAESVGLHFEGKISEVKDQFAEACAQVRMESYSAMVRDYLRLTVEAEETLRQLEETKHQLIQICTDMDDDIEEKMNPFCIVVDHVAAGKEFDDDEDDQYDLISEQFGKKIARAIDKKRITIDETIDINKYLEGKVSWLTDGSGEGAEPVPEQPEDLNETSGEADTSPESSEENAESLPENNDGEAETVDASETEKNGPIGNEITEQSNHFLEGYGSYLDESTEIRIEGNAPAKKASATVLIRQLKDIPGLSYTIGKLMLTKMIPYGESEEFYEKRYRLKYEGINFLKKQEYCGRILIKTGNEESAYYYLNAKGIASYGKETVREYCKKAHEPYESIGRFSANPERWSKLFVMRCKMLLDYLHHLPSPTVNPWIVKVAEKYELISTPQSFWKNKKVITYCVIPLILDKESEKDDIECLNTSMPEDSEATLLLVKTKNDISLIKDVVKEDVLKSTVFVALEEPTIAFDSKLNPIYLGRPLKGPNIDYKIVDGKAELLEEEESEESEEKKEQELAGEPQEEAAVSADEQVPDETEHLEEPETETESAVNESVPEAEVHPQAEPKVQANTSSPASEEKQQNEAEAKKKDVPEIQETSELDAEASRYIQVARRAFDIHRWDVGSVLLNGICQYSPKYSSLKDQYAFATDDPMLGMDYRASNLIKHFDEKAGVNPEHDLLAISAWLRMCFSDAASIEIYLSANVSQFQDSLAYEYSPSLKDVVFKFSEWIQSQARGLDRFLLDSVLKQNGVEIQIDELKKEAHEMLENDTLTKTNHLKRRIIETRRNLFGKDSDIIAALKAIDASDISKIGELKGKLRAYVTVENGNVIVNEDAVIEQMDDAWRATDYLAKGKGRAEQLIGVERGVLSKKLIYIYHMIGRWISMTENRKQISSAENQQAIRLIRYLGDTVPAVIAELNRYRDENLALRSAKSVLVDTLKELLARVRGENNAAGSAAQYYIHLLQYPIVALDDNYLPYIEKSDEQIEPFDFCRRVERYMILPQRPWEEVIHDIFNVNEKRDGCDYGCARVIQAYLDENKSEGEWPADCDIDRAVARALDKSNKRLDSVYLWQQNFTAMLEMADGDGWFTTVESRKNIEKIKDAVYRTYYLEDNFGFYGRALNRLLKYAHDQAMKLCPQYQARLARIRETLNDEDASAFILSRIDELIKAGRFGAAESYMQQVERGELTLTGGLGDNESVFSNFVARCGILCDACKLNQRLADHYSAQFKYRKNNNTMTGEAMLRAWPETRTTAPEIFKILKYMGLDLKNVNATRNDGTGFHAEIRSPGRIENYPHPIANFGSVMYEKGLDIELIFGNKTPETLFSDINGILQKSSGKPLLIMVNCAIRLADRRKLARLISESLRTTAPCLVMDRVLIRYVAEFPVSERWRVFIECALPFQLVSVQNPYKENSSVEIPPDMFIGRRDELASIISPDGANLLYGGRQLGKTALLQRAKVLQHRPDEHSWSTYIDVKKMGSVEAAETILKNLMYAGFIKKQRSRDYSWLNLCNAIEARLMEGGKEDSLLLLIDEADTLLEDSQKNGYKELDQFKRLQNMTGGRFKFVMAGLHNLVRFNQKALANNSGVPQLKGITVKPLSFMDARELLEKPLSFMGFTIPKGEEDVVAQILFNTNYFPGLIHFYASRLIQYMQKNATPASMPPYRLDRDVLIRLLADDDFRNLRKERLLMTLGIDVEENSYYDTLAYALCSFSYESDDIMNYGMTAKELYEECYGFNPHSSIAKLDVHKVDALLKELVILNILRTETDGEETRYLFSRASFIEMLGTKTQVEDHLLEALGGE